MVITKNRSLSDIDANQTYRVTEKFQFRREHRCGCESRDSNLDLEENFEGVLFGAKSKVKARSE